MEAFTVGVIGGAVAWTAIDILLRGVARVLRS